MSRKTLTPAQVAQQAQWAAAEAAHKAMLAARDAAQRAKRRPVSGASERLLVAIFGKAE